MVQRAVNAKAKAGLKSSIMVWDLDAYCPKSYHSSYNTFLKMQFQGSNIKDFFHSKEPKPKDLKPAPLYNNTTAEPAKKKDRTDKKKRFWRQMQEYTRE